MSRAPSSRTTRARQTVRVGTPIGANGGSVKAIERGKLRVEESIDFYGDRQPRAQ
jgi:Tfp pilus assembly protein PilP